MKLFYGSFLIILFIQSALSFNKGDDVYIEVERKSGSGTYKEKIIGVFDGRMGRRKIKIKNKDINSNENFYRNRKDVGKSVQSFEIYFVGMPIKVLDSSDSFLFGNIKNIFIMERRRGKKEAIIMFRDLSSNQRGKVFVNLQKDPFNKDNPLKVIIGCGRFMRARVGKKINILNEIYKIKYIFQDGTFVLGRDKSEFLSFSDNYIIKTYRLENKDTRCYR